MIPIIGEGSERDPHAIHLATREGTYVPNFRRTEDPPDVRRGAVEMFKEHVNAKLRSISSTYNCVGHVFACRRTWIETDHLAMILKEDGYTQLTDQDALFVGDVVLYENNNGETTHVAGVVDTEPDLAGDGRSVFVLSKWGPYGEYIHELFDVPLLLGTPKTFWTERREV